MALAGRTALMACQRELTSQKATRRLFIIQEPRVHGAVEQRPMVVLLHHMGRAGINSEWFIERDPMFKLVALDSTRRRWRLLFNKRGHAVLP